MRSKNGDVISEDKSANTGLPQAPIVAHAFNAFDEATQETEINSSE